MTVSSYYSAGKDEKINIFILSSTISASPLLTLLKTVSLIISKSISWNQSRCSHFWLSCTRECIQCSLLTLLLLLLVFLFTLAENCLLGQWFSNFYVLKIHLEILRLWFSRSGTGSESLSVWLTSPRWGWCCRSHCKWPDSNRLFVSSETLKTSLWCLDTCVKFGHDIFGSHFFPQWLCRHCCTICWRWKFFGDSEGSLIYPLQVAWFLCACFFLAWKPQDCCFALSLKFSVFAGDVSVLTDGWELFSGMWCDALLNPWTQSFFCFARVTWIFLFYFHLNHFF